MPVDLQLTNFSGIWRGLMVRRRQIDHDLAESVIHPELYAVEATNVELLGNVLGRRLGTKRTHKPSELYGRPGNRRIFGLFQAKWRRGTGVADEILVASGPNLQVAGDPPGLDFVYDFFLPPGMGTRVTPEYPVQFTQFNNCVFIVDGTNPNLKYFLLGGAPRISAMGIVAPVAAPTVALVAGTLTSALSGYIYRYTYVNSVTQAVSEPSPDIDELGRIAMGSTAKGVKITFAASPDPQVDRVRIYRTTDGGSFSAEPGDPLGGGFLIADVADTAGSYTDNTPDNQIEGGDKMEEFLNDPPFGPFRYLTVWPQANRLLGVSRDAPSVLRYSDLTLGRLKPESWPPENIIYVALDSGDEITGLFPFTDSVIIFCRRSIFRLRGVPPDDMVLDVVQFDNDSRTAIGAFSQQALVQVDDNVVSPFIDGVYAMNRFVDTQGGFTSSRLSRPIDDLWAELNPLAALWSHAVFLRERKQVRFWVPYAQNTTPSRAFIYQLDVGANDSAPAGWTVWEFAGGAVNITASLVVETADGDACYIGTDQGWLCQMDSGLTDFWYDDPTTEGIDDPGTAYPFIWEGTPIYLAQDDREARGRFVDVVWSAGSHITLTCRPLTDFGVEWPMLPFTIDPQGVFILDVSQLDIGRLGGRQLRQQMRGALLTRGGLQTVRWRCDTPGIFAIEAWRLLWQPLAQKARSVIVTQGLANYPFVPDVDEGGFGEGGFGEGGFGE